MVSTRELWSLVDGITDLTVLQKSVLVALVRFSGPKNGYCSWRSYSTLAKVTCASRRGVVNAVSQLSEQGLITLEKRKRTASENYSNVYQLNIGSIISRVAELQNCEVSALLEGLSSELTSLGGELSAPPDGLSSELTSLGGELSALPDDLSSEFTSLGW
ncbi:helix-turn-helix domain-containing protein [Vibrio parahaemolyticus]